MPAAAGAAVAEAASAAAGGAEIRHGRSRPGNRDRLPHEWALAGTASIPKGVPMLESNCRRAVRLLALLALVGCSTPVAAPPPAQSTPPAPASADIDQGRVEIMATKCHGVTQRSYGDWAISLDVQLVTNSRPLAVDVASRLSQHLRRGSGCYAQVTAAAGGAEIPLWKDMNPGLKELYDQGARVHFHYYKDADVTELGADRYAITLPVGLYCLTEPPRDVDIVFLSKVIQEGLSQEKRADRVPPGGVTCPVVRMTLPPIKPVSPPVPPTEAATIRVGGLATQP